MGVARGLAAGSAFVAAAVGLAFHAAAEPPLGRYTAMLIDEASGQEIPGKTTLMFDRCGPNCAHLALPSGELDLHLLDGSWTGTAQTLDGQTCTHSVDARLVWTQSCSGSAVRSQLRKSN